MSELIDKAKRHGINISVLTLALGIVGTSVLLIGQERVLQGMGVVVEEQLEKHLNEQKAVDKIQDERIKQVQEDVHSHASMPGHGVSINESNNLNRRVETLERDRDKARAVNSQLLIAVERLSGQVENLNQRIDRLPQ